MSGAVSLDNYVPLGRNTGENICAAQVVKDTALHSTGVNLFLIFRFQK